MWLTNILLIVIVIELFVIRKRIAFLIVNFSNNFNLTAQQLIEKVDQIEENTH